LWYGDDDALSANALSAIDIHETFVEVIIEADVVERFCAVVGNEGESMWLSLAWSSPEMSLKSTFAILVCVMGTLLSKSRRGTPAEKRSCKAQLKCLNFPPSMSLLDTVPKRLVWTWTFTTVHLLPALSEKVLAPIFWLFMGF
jgi:hypothetical protein